MNTPLISIIVPVYKVEQYLSKCVDSILNQTYKNLEIILVDDGSPDSCPKICDDYAKIDSRIIVLHKVNAGLSAARNSGLTISRGDYISFIDSDDWVSSDFIEKLYFRIVNDKSDFVMCNFEQVDELGRKVNNFKQISLTEKRILDFQEFWDVFKEHTAVNIVAWNKLYKKEIFSDLKYPEGHIHEDVFIMPLIMEKVTKVSQEPSTLYYYLKRGNSIVGTLKKEFNFDADKFLAESKICFYFSKKKLFSLCAMQMLNTVIDSTMGFKKLKTSEADKTIFYNVRERLKHVYKNNKIEFKREGEKFNVYMQLFYCNVSLFYFVYTISQIIKRMKISSR
ncbi:glycosyltransferase family 2 protein [Treponema socranskii]|uniref:glycosyltransferase family 2 protein n=1 Tax=Treponema socranskii TaxID=53419 RepID=UPI003D6E22C5